MTKRALSFPASPYVPLNNLYVMLPITLLCYYGARVGASVNPNDPMGGSADFSYSQVFDVDLSSDADDEEDSMTFLPARLYARGDRPLLLRSEIRFCGITHDTDNGCIVSSEAYVDEKPEFGDSRLSSSPLHLDFPWAVDDHDPFNITDLGRNDDQADDEDDDEDDDGGHSSMLSNAAVRNKHRDGVEGPRNQGEEAKTTSPHLMLASLRGGATSNMVSNILKSDMSKKLFVTALVTLLFEGALGHVLEHLKICMQTSSNDATYFDVIKSITSEKGVIGLWDGFIPWGVVQAICKGAVFGIAHAAASKYLKPLADDGTIPLALALTMAGGIGGGFQGYVLSPTLLLKTRVMTNPVFREKISLLQTTLLSFRLGWDVVKKEGAMTLMKGSNVFALKRVFDWSSRYFFADLFELMLRSLQNGKQLSIAQQSIASLLGGVASTCATLPLDVLVAKMQDAKKAGVKVSALEMFLEELKEKGVDGLSQAYLRGFGARLLHVCLTTAVVKNGTPLAYDLLFKP